MTATPPEGPGGDELPDCPLTQQTVGWALHALEPDEEMAVLLHLPQCATCRAAAHEAEEVLAGLAGVVPAADPPPSLRNRILAEAAATPQRPAVLRPRADAADTTGAPAPAAGSSPRPHRLDAEAAGPVRPARRGRRLVAAGLAVAAALAVGVLAVRAGQLEQQRDAETVQAQNLSDLVREIAEPGTRYALLNDQATGAPVAAVVLEDGEPRVYPVGLPPNGEGSLYVAWGLTAEGTPVPLGGFDVLAAEQGPVPVGSGPGAQDFPQYAVSIEPGRDVPDTPSTVVASGQVTS
jgi:hypothetical protein